MALAAERLVRYRAGAALALRAAAPEDEEDPGFGAEDALDVFSLQSALEGELLAVMKTSGLFAGQNLYFRFDSYSQRAVDWVRQHAGELIVDITESQRRAIVRLIEQGFTKGIPPRELARKIVRTGIGLTDAGMLAVENYEKALIASGVSGADLANKVERYANRLLRQRTETIARTETMRASNEGQREAWRQAAEKGLIEAGARKVWIVAPVEVCPRCEALDGAVTDMFGVYPGEGEQGPPLHPNCRCVEGLASAEDIAEYEARVEADVKGQEFYEENPELLVARAAREGVPA